MLHVHLAYGEKDTEASYQHTYRIPFCELQHYDKAHFEAMYEHYAPKIQSLCDQFAHNVHALFM